MVRLQKFNKKDFGNLISWLDSEEILVQIAGRQMTFPVTEAQLDLSQSDKNRYAFSVIHLETGRSIGHCELYLLEDSAKIDRLIIGDRSMKGKGLCAEIIKLLLDYGFNVLNQSKIELNVFDWNISAIRCYEKAGLIRNPDKRSEFEINGKKWAAVSMSIGKQTYDQIKNQM